MTTIIRLTRPPGQNGAEPGEILLEGDIEDVNVYNAMQEELTKQHEAKND